MDMEYATCGCGFCSAPRGFSAEIVEDGPLSFAPAFDLNQIVHQLRSQWSGSWDGDYVRWNKPSVTFSINVGDVDQTVEMGGRVGLTSLMQARAFEAFTLWDDLMPIALQQSALASADITFNMSSATNGDGTYASMNRFTPLIATNTYALADSDIWLASEWASHNRDSAMGYGGYGIYTYLHEIGHALGLSHPGSYNAGGGGSITYGANAEYAQDTRRFSIMSYFNANDDGSGTDHVGSGGSLNFAQTPMVHDVHAIQTAYGVSGDTRVGNTTYGFNSNSGRAVFDFAVNTNPIVTIFDSAGFDTIDLSRYTAANRLDLNSGAYSDVGGFMTNNLGIAYTAVIENGVGGSGSDTIIGNAFGNLLKGNRGNDTLYGNGGYDIAVYDLAASAYTITERNGGQRTQINNATDGQDTLFDIERLQFSDGFLWLIDGSATFDSLFYGRAYADVYRAQIAPMDHYLTNGWREGRDPSAQFSTGGYLRANGDVAAAGFNPLVHYDNNGWREGRDPSLTFDTQGYLGKNPDVRAAGLNPLAHYTDFGKYEGRATTKMVGSTDGNGFDSRFYLMANADVAAAGIDPAAHFYTFGWREGRAASSHFDTAGYLAKYGDVRNAGINPLVHYSTNGWRENRDPAADFDTSQYRAVYRDIGAAGVNPLLHYMSSGIGEGRTTWGDGVFD